MWAQILMYPCDFVQWKFSVIQFLNLIFKIGLSVLFRNVMHIKMTQHCIDHDNTQDNNLHSVCTV